MERLYDEEYYDWLTERTVESARVVVPLVLDLVQPRSILDVGCGIGLWPAVFHEHGVGEVWGVDGAWVDSEALRIPRERFIEADLSAPLRLDRSFDLVVSLEVAEHLAEASAETFVDTLTRHGPVILFSAAIPGQGGTGHVNEQWPDYWITRFHRRGYVVADALRREVWEDERVAWWYAQNLFVFVREDSLAAHPRLAREAERTPARVLPVVHPEMFGGCRQQASALRARADELWAWAVHLEEAVAAAQRPDRISPKLALRALASRGRRLFLRNE